MSRDDETIQDIVTATEQILISMDGVSFGQLTDNREKQAAILYFIIIIGEATKRLSPKFRQANPQIDWQSMAGMRDIVVHQYDRVNIQVVWDVVQTDLPELLILLKSLSSDRP